MTNATNLKSWLDRAASAKPWLVPFWVDYLLTTQNNCFFIVSFDVALHYFFKKEDTTYGGVGSYLMYIIFHCFL